MSMLARLVLSSLTATVAAKDGADAQPHLLAGYQVLLQPLQLVFASDRIEAESAV
jgi:hypothetical protein